MAFNIAIDGPAGAGKSTIAKQVAKELSFVYVDTGAMFRAMALYCIRHGIDGEDRDAVERACEDIEVTISYENDQQQVLLNGENVNAFLRVEEAGKMASLISVYGKVREKLRELQQRLALEQNVVMDGRDIGSCVLPDAQLKVYLTASVETRGKRRYLELLEKGAACDLKEICGDITARDDRDMHRKIAPLVQAEDAVRVDSSEMTIPEVTERILHLVQKAQEKETEKA